MNTGQTRGLILEGVVIVLSILAAFLLEGWREDNEFADELRLELASVQNELQRNQVLLGSTLSNLERIESAGSQLLELLDESDGSMVSVADTLAWVGAIWSTSFDASLGAMKALISSGRLPGIEDTELRLGLAGLEDSVRDAIEEELEARQITIDHIIPMLGDRTDFAPIERVVSAFFDTSSATTGLTITEGLQTRAIPSFATFQFPNSLAIRNAIRVRLIWVRNAQDEYRRLDHQLGGLVMSLEGETR